MENQFDLINKAALARRLGLSKESVSSWFRTDPPKIPRAHRREVVRLVGVSYAELFKAMDGLADNKKGPDGP